MRNGILGWVSLAIWASATPASAGIMLSLQLELDTTDGVNSVSYLCENGTSLAAQYVNAGANSLAILTIEGEERVFVNVLSGSGARYVSGQYVWWTKGGSATLEDQLPEGGREACLLRDPEPPERPATLETP